MSCGHDDVTEWRVCDVVMGLEWSHVSDWYDAPRFSDLIRVRPLAAAASYKSAVNALASNWLPVRRLVYLPRRFRPTIRPPYLTIGDFTNQLNKY